MPIMYLTCGLPASGKYAYIASSLIPLGVQYISVDDLRFTVSGGLFQSRALYARATAALCAETLMRRGLSLAIHGSFGKLEHYRPWLTLAERLGYEVSLLRFTAEADECRARMETKDPSFPMEHIATLDTMLTREWVDIRRHFVRKGYPIVYVDKTPAPNSVAA